MKTPLTYYGGKQRLAGQIVALMPRHTAYLEPFAGGAAVLFSKPPADRETLNDLDGQIMRFWRALRDRPDELASAVACTPYSRAEWEASREPVEDDVEAARRLLVRFSQSWSKEGKSWSPPAIAKASMNRWQPRTWQAMPERIRVAAGRLAGVCLEQVDAVEMIGRWNLPDTVIYVDPPYVGPDRRHLSHGYSHDLTPDLWPRLVDALAEVEHAAVLLSGYPNDEVERLGWRSMQLEALSGVAPRSSGKRYAVPETLWLSPAVPEPIPDLLSGVVA